MNINRIEGIGPVIANKLGEQGITTTQGLLEAAANRQARRQLAAQTGLSEELLLGWVNRADLMRVRGVGEEYSDLLEAAGVDTVKELGRRRPDNLHGKIVEVNAEKRLVRRAPSVTEVGRWVADAEMLPAVVTYSN